MFQLLRTHTGLAIVIALMLAMAVVLTVVGVMMAGQGGSLKPIYWMAGFALLIVGPQFVGHLYRALNASRQAAPRIAALRELATSTEIETRRAAARQLFGPDAEPHLVTDARRTFIESFKSADLAQYAILPNGETVLLAKFGSGSAAEKAWVQYLRESGLNQLGGQGDSQRGYAVTRLQMDRAYAIHLNDMVGVWTGRDDAAIRARMRAGGFVVPWRAPLAEATASTTTPDKPAASEGSAPRPRFGLIATGLFLYLLVVSAYYFKGASWAGMRTARPGTPPVSATELASRLAAFNQAEVPFHIEPGQNPGEFFATWRFADAKWLDLARARGMRRTFRIRLRLDEANRTVRTMDYESSFEASAGRGGASVEWKARLGIVFFQYEHQRVLGLQLDERGRITPDLSYAYTFRLEEMKGPLTEAVTRAGWNWRPMVWDGPAWLRWLTE
jgi:hypothetical protein